MEVDGHDVDAVDLGVRGGVLHQGAADRDPRPHPQGQGRRGGAGPRGDDGKPLPDADEAIAKLGGPRDLRVRVPEPPAARVLHAVHTGQAEPPRWDKGEKAATRNAFGEALAALGTVRGDVVVLDGEVGDSTRAEFFAKEHPERYVECYIAEQQLGGHGGGDGDARLGALRRHLRRLPRPRAHDFIRMASVSGAGVNLVGSHAGVAIGEDGPSQMGLEDLAMMRAVHGSTVPTPRRQPDRASGRRDGGPRRHPVPAHLAGPASRPPARPRSHTHRNGGTVGMTVVPAQQSGGGGGSSGLDYASELVLDRGLVIDAFVRVSLVGIEILKIDVRVVVASVDNYPPPPRHATGSTWSPGRARTRACPTWSVR
ncbi:Gas vesicle structural protein [Streptomyces hirsutus]